MSLSVSWEEGIIGQWEKFLMNRYPIGPMWARALPSALVSATLSGVTLEDKMGPVKPNAWWMYIGPSGFGYKTPPLRLIKDVTIKFNPHLLAVSKFTPEGFTEWVMGLKEKKEKDEVIQPGIPPHYANFIIRDETSKLLGESSTHQHMATLKEYLSELWDGWIEGYYTRRMKYEGNTPVYVTFLSATSDYFFSVLEESYFRQGIGNRILVIVEETKKPEKLDEESFFFRQGEEDTELHQLEKQTIERLKVLSSLCSAYLMPKARKLWIDFQYRTALQVYRDKGLSASFKIKQPLNCLKLAMIYSASRMNADFKNKILLISGEDMQRAIEDTDTYFDMWEKAMRWWQRTKEAGKRKEKRLHSSKYELLDFLAVALKKEGLCSVSSISAALDLPDRAKIRKIIGLGVSKGWLEIAAEQGEKGSLKSYQYAWFTPKRGYSPQIFRVTEKGREASSKEKVLV